MELLPITVNGEAVRSKSSGLELEYNKRLGESGKVGSLKHIIHNLYK